MKRLKDPLKILMSLILVGFMCACSGGPDVPGDPVRADLSAIEDDDDDDSDTGGDTGDGDETPITTALLQCGNGSCADLTWDIYTLNPLCQVDVNSNGIVDTPDEDVTNMHIDLLEAANIDEVCYAASATCISAVVPGYFFTCVIDDTQTDKIACVYNLLETDAGCVSTLCPFDIDQNGIVDTDDKNKVQNNLGQDCIQN